MTADTNTMTKENETKEFRKLGAYKQKGKKKKQEHKLTANLIEK